MKYTPVLVGALVGVGDGAISQSTSLSKHKYAHGAYKFGILALGAAGEMFLNWNPNISYGMMTAASTLIGARIPAAFEGGGIKAIATYTEPAKQNATSAGHVAAKTGCSSCGALAAAKHAHALALPKLGEGEWRAREQTATGAG